MLGTLVGGWRAFMPSGGIIPILASAFGTCADTKAANHHLQRFADAFKIFADHLGDRLAPERRDLYEQFLDAALRLLARYYSHRNLTVVHGDAHVWNFFLPGADSDDVRLFDRDSWRIGIGAASAPGH